MNKIRMKKPAYTHSPKLVLLSLSWVKLILSFEQKASPRSVSLRTNFINYEKSNKNKEHD